MYKNGEQTLSDVSLKTGLSYNLLWYKMKMGQLSLPLTDEECERIKEDFNKKKERKKVKINHQELEQLKINHQELQDLLKLLREKVYG